MAIRKSPQAEAFSVGGMHSDSYNEFVNKLQEVIPGQEEGRRATVDAIEVLKNFEQDTFPSEEQIMATAGRFSVNIVGDVRELLDDYLYFSKNSKPRR